MERLTSRKIFFYGLLLLAFFLPILGSTLIFVGFRHPKPATPHRLISQTVYSLCCLGVLAWVLKRQGKRFSNIGLIFPPTLTDIGHSILLYIGMYIGFVITYLFAVTFFEALSGHRYHPWDFQPSLFGTSITVFPFLLALVNPWYEELLVRAFLISEVEDIYGFPMIAALASILLQTSYHFYQGFLPALSLATCFFIFTWYYVRTRRILPVILAHLYMDIIPLLFYFRSLHPQK